MSVEPGRITQALITAALEGDDHAWSGMVDSLYPLVAGVVRNHLRRTSDRDDVIQEVFIKIFTKLGQYAGRQPFEHWVSRITLNTCHDWLRRMTVRPLVTYSDLSEEERAILDKTAALDEPIDGEPPTAMRELLDRLLSTLNPREQIVIRLLDLEQRSVDDICNLTGWGSSKVKVTALRARRKLSSQMQRMERQSTRFNP